MKLYDYQKQGINFLVSKHGGMLLDEQGLGEGRSSSPCNSVPSNYERDLVASCS